MARLLALVMGVLPSISASSGSASTVTLIFHGLKFCSDTVRNGECGAVSIFCALVFTDTVVGMFLDAVEVRLEGIFRLLDAAAWMVSSSLIESARGSGELKSSLRQETTEGDRNIVASVGVEVVRA